MSDGLWTQHLDLVQDLIVNAQLSVAGHNSVVAELVFRAEDAYRKFIEQTADKVHQPIGDVRSRRGNG